MSNYVVARNYAEALVAVAAQGAPGDVERFGQLLEAVSGVIATDPGIKAVLMSPRVTKQAKRDLLARALREVAPPAFIAFLGAVVQRGRQGMLDDISQAYLDQVDVRMNRVHAGVVTAHPVDEALARDIKEKLEHAIGKTVVPHFDTNPELMGGVVVRIGDRMFDGSLRRRLRVLRHRMLNTPQ